MHERRYQNDVNELRNSERIKRLGLEKIIRLSLREAPRIKTLLDIGTGSGLFAEQFADKNIKVTGLDVNPKMLKAARKYLPNSIFHIGIAENLPYPKNTFDSAFMGYLLHETDDHLVAMKEAYRVVRYRLTVLEWPDIDQANGPPSDHRLSHDQIKDFANQAGFSHFKKFSLASAVLYNFNK